MTDPLRIFASTVCALFKCVNAYSRYTLFLHVLCNFLKMEISDFGAKLGFAGFCRLGFWILGLPHVELALLCLSFVREMTDLTVYEYYAVQ